MCKFLGSCVYIGLIEIWQRESGHLCFQVEAINRLEEDLQTILLVVVQLNTMFYTPYEDLAKPSLRPKSSVLVFQIFARV